MPDATSNTLSLLRAGSARSAFLLAAWCGAGVAHAAELPLAEGTVLRFAEVREGIAALTRRDDYIRQMSPFDRRVRLHADHDVSVEEFLAFISGHVVPWQAADIEKLAPHVEALRQKLAEWKLKLPDVVLLVKTDGREESGAAYCRGSAIVLPENMLNGSKQTLDRVLPHELFHIISSHNPLLREALYGVIGFRACNEVSLPDPLAARKITNPDAPVNDHYITVEMDSRRIELMPVLLSKTEQYDPASGGTLFSLLDFKLLLLEADGTTRRPAMPGGKPVLLDPASTPGFMEQVGRNTRYLIHPEEILADNFVFLLNGRIDLPTPRIVAEMGKVLQEAAARQ